MNTNDIITIIVAFLATNVASEVITRLAFPREFQVKADSELAKATKVVVEMYVQMKDDLQERIDTLERKYDEQGKAMQRQSCELKRRLKLLARIIVDLLDALGDGRNNVCIDDFLQNGISDEDKRFLLHIIEEANDEH